jgi:hypothetical protein
LSKRGRKQALAEQRKALQSKLAQRREAAQVQLERRRDTKKNKKRRRRRWPWLVLLALVLLVLLRDCSCAEEPPPPPPPEPTAPSGPPAELVQEAPPEAQSPAPRRVARRDRPEYGNEKPPALPWLDAFRLQVAARSPRLAACFIGAERPGRLKWSASVEPIQGTVSDHTLQPTLSTAALTRQQRSCLVDVLSDPSYRLDAGDPQATPSRVSMVIEF